MSVLAARRESQEPLSASQQARQLQLNHVLLRLGAPEVSEGVGFGWMCVVTHASAATA